MDFAPLPQQRRAIEAAPGPVLVVAGPGAGKTFCLIARITHLVDTLGVAPERICAVTFTNRAAEEIALRLKNTVRDRADALKRGAIPARTRAGAGASTRSYPAGTSSASTSRGVCCERGFPAGWRGAARWSRTRWV